MNAIRACTADQAESDLRAYPALRRSFQRARGGVGAALAEAEARGAAALERERAILGPRDAPWLALERATLAFRLERSRAYRGRAAEARKGAKRFRDAAAVAEVTAAEEQGREWRPALAGAPSLSGRAFSAVVGIEALRDLSGDAARRARWYEGRAAAQITRFSGVRACGSAGLRVACRVCESTATARPIPSRCGVVRICDACADHRDQERRSRIAEGRLRALAVAKDLGLDVPTRAGGAVGEKMLTVTVPHFELEAAGGLVRAECTGFLGTTVAARVAALRLAWPRFLRALRRLLRRRDRLALRAFRYFRAWEWTRGNDGLGHPHLHVYLLSPFLPLRELRHMWAAALEAVGVPCPRTCTDCHYAEDGEGCEFGHGAPHAVIDLRAVKQFDWRALRELVKSGDRKLVAERLGVLRDSAGAEIVHDYAAGWTFGEAFDAAGRGLPSKQELDVQRDLFVAGEGRRLFQGSRGFLTAPPVRPCDCCGALEWTAGVVRGWEACEGDVSEDVPPSGERERGPP